jgi:hypothetical protein
MVAPDNRERFRPVLDGSRLKPESAELWLRPQIKIKHQGAECLGPRDGDMATGVAWGLG